MQYPYFYAIATEGSIGGFLPSDCKVPCLTTSVTATEGAQFEKYAENNSSSIYISINNDVKIKTVSVDKFQFMESLNFLGSNLGLWPGLGLFQLVEGVLVVIFAYNWKEITNET